MIKGIVNGAFIDVSGGAPTIPYVTVDPDNPTQGMICLRGNDFQVWDGHSWVQIDASYPTVSLNSSAQSAISWAMKKMSEEAALEQLSESHPAVKAAYENMKRAAEQLKATIILSKEHDSV